MNFIEEFEIVQERTHAINRKNGFWEELDRLAAEPGGNVHVALSRIALMHSELSEAVEAIRKQPPEDWASLKKDSLSRELAGTIVRIMDMAEWLQLPLGSAIIAELDENSVRGHRHGGKAA